MKNQNKHEGLPEPTESDIRFIKGVARDRGICCSDEDAKRCHYFAVEESTDADEYYDAVKEFFLN